MEASDNNTFMKVHFFQFDTIFLMYWPNMHYLFMLSFQRLLALPIEKFVRPKLHDDRNNTSQSLCPKMNAKKSCMSGITLLVTNETKWAKCNMRSAHVFGYFLKDFFKYL